MKPFYGFDDATKNELSKFMVPGRSDDQAATVTDIVARATGIDPKHPWEFGYHSNVESLECDLLKELHLGR